MAREFFSGDWAAGLGLGGGGVAHGDRLAGCSSRSRRGWLTEDGHEKAPAFVSRGRHLNWQAKNQSRCQCPREGCFKSPRSRAHAMPATSIKLFIPRDCLFTRSEQKKTRSRNFGSRSLPRELLGSLLVNQQKSRTVMKSRIDRLLLTCGLWITANSV